MKVRVVLAVAFSLLLLPLAGAQDAAEVVKAYGRNVDAFPFYRCTYTITRGKGVVDERTFTVKWEKGADTAKCRYAVDGEYEAFEQGGHATPKPTKMAPSPDGQPTTGFQLIEGIMSEKMIRGPKSHGRWAEAFNNMNLLDRTRHDVEGDSFAPLDFGFGHRRTFDPVRMLAQPSVFPVKSLGEKEVMGRRCVGLLFEAPADQLTLGVNFDLAQGMIPLKLDMTQNNRTRRTVVVSARKLSKERWFPERILQYTPGDKPDYMMEYVLEEVDADKRPTTDELSITLPDGAVIMDTHDHQGFKLRKAEKVSGYDLPELFEKTKQAASEQPMDTALEHRRPGISVWFWVLGGVGFALVALGAFQWFRRKRANRHAGGSGSA